MRRPLERIIFVFSALGMIAALVIAVLLIQTRLDTPSEPVIVEKIVEVVVERIVEVTPVPSPIKCWFAAIPPDLPMINIPLVDVGPPPAGYTGVVGYLCDDTMHFKPDLPRGAEVMNVEAHVGATKGATNGF